jgi:hypothetical protein
VRFGSVRVGQSATRRITLRNHDDARRTIVARITGRNASEFSVSRSDCPSGGARLGRAATCELLVTFTPAQRGRRSAKLRLAVSPCCVRALALEGDALAMLDPGPASDPRPPPAPSSTATAT